MTELQPPLPGSMPDRIPENTRPPEGFDAMAVAKGLLRATRAGTLATLDRNVGYPFASLTNIATDTDGSPIILVSRLATHTANLERDGRASVLLAAGGKGDPLAHPRLTVLGVFVRRDDEPRLARRFLTRHPKAALYAGFSDFSFWRMSVVSGHLNGGFARAADLTDQEILTRIEDAEDLIAAEESALEHMNADHAEALALYASKLLRRSGSNWRVTGIDPEGLDLAAGDNTARLPFPRRIIDGTGLRQMLRTLAEEARAKR